MITDNVHALLSELAGGNGKGEPVTLVAATKTRTPEEINEAIAAGITDVGENKVQEFTAKFDAVRGGRRHFIGHLQTNKVKYLVGKADLIQSLDRTELADELQKRAERAGWTANCLLEVNIGSELSKSGFSLQEAQQAYASLSAYPNLHLEGLMAMLPFTDDEGVLRYEMVLEGYGPDRILFDDDDIITCVSSGKLARINGLGRVEQVCELGEYVLHHDIGFGQEGEILALAEIDGAENVEDQLLSIDMETGEVVHLIDFTEAMSGYFDMTRPIKATDPFFWQAGEWDWIHLNSLQYLEEEDSLIVSSRETSTIIKLEQIHGEPELAWLAGDERFWEDTPYAEYCLEQEGDFVPQYGQHCVEYLRAGEEDGVYYLSMFDNNYWCLNSRDDFEMEVSDAVGTDLYGLGSEVSHVYVYKIDENAGTFALEESFDVPYSSIVSNGSQCGTEGNWIVNSGVSKVFGEYDAEGRLIREFAYECDMQNYRTFKYDYTGFWFR